MYQGYPLFPIFRAASTVIPLLPRDVTVDVTVDVIHHPSRITSVSLVPDLRLLPPSTPFWPYGTHTFFPHAQTISILSNSLYSLTPFLFQLSYAPRSSFLNLSIRDTPTKHLKLFISKTFTFLLAALLIPHASAPCNAVGTITPSYRHFLAQSTLKKKSERLFEHFTSGNFCICE